MLEFSELNIKKLARLGSRGAFGLALLELGHNNSNILAVVPDIATLSGLDRFKNTYPDRLYNLGIAEQNAIGVAAGLSKEGFNVFTTSYAVFASFRSADQIRVNMGYMKLPIKLEGICAGYNVSFLGATHMALEDIAVMRSIPNITIVSPSDNLSVIKATIAAAKYDMPIYIRLGGASPDPIIYKSDFNFEIGKAIELKSGSDISIIATGGVVYNALKASELLEDNGISVSVIDMHTIKPLDVETINKACNAKMIVSIEEHSKIGGLGGAIAEVLSAKATKPPLLIVGTDDYYPHAASRDDLLDSSGLSVEKIYYKILEFYKEIK